MINSFIFAYACCLTHFIFPTDSKIHTLYVFVFLPMVTMMKLAFKLLKILSVSLSSTQQWLLYFPLNNQNRTLFACYCPFFTSNLGYTKAESSLLFIIEVGLFRLIVCVIFTPFHINVTVFISWKPYVMLVTFTCRRCSTDVLYVDLIKEKKLGRRQRRKLFFVIPGWDMIFFHLFLFVINEQYGEVK